MLFGCSAAKRPNPLEAALDESGARAVGGGGARISKLEGRAVRGDLEAGFLVTLEPNVCYAVLGAGDDTLSAIDLFVSAPSGSWVARTTQSEPRPVVRFCAKQAGPHRIAATFTGRGQYLVGVYGPKPLPSASAASSAPVLASVAPPNASASASALPAACSSQGENAPFQRMVSGGERSCQRDDDCISVKIDCSQLRCAGIHRAYRGSYNAPLDCRGYGGPVGNYDCDPQFGIEAPRCRDGCCVSERVEKGH